MQVLGDIIRLNAKRYPEKKALIMGEESLTFKEFNGLANKIAHGLGSIGVKPGDRVAIWSKNCLEFPPIAFAIWKCGAIMVPINFRFKKEEAAHLFLNAQPEVLFYAEDLSPVVEVVLKDYPKPVRAVVISGQPFESGESLSGLIEGASDQEPELQVDPESTAMVMYTSGTTGVPKGVIFTHSKEIEDVMNHSMEMEIKHEDVMLVNMPLFHNGGFSASLMIALIRGCTCVIMAGSFDPKIFFSTIDRFKITIANVVPTMLAKLLEYPGIKDHSLASLKKILYGSSPISESVLNAALKAFKVDFFQMYGQTETGMLLALRPADHYTERSRHTGRPLCRAEVRVVDEKGQDVPMGGVGEIISRQKPLGMDGYYGSEDATKDTIRDGWIHTGDLVRVEPNGYYTVVDRLKDMIISGAENIYSKEIENVIAEHPSVEEVTVFGIPDDMWGEAVCALVVRRKEKTLTEQEIMDFCGTRLSGYKRPKRVELRDELPKNAAGKVVKKLLKEPYWAGRDKRV